MKKTKNGSTHSTAAEARTSLLRLFLFIFLFMFLFSYVLIVLTLIGYREPVIEVFREAGGEGRGESLVWERS